MQSKSQSAANPHEVQHAWHSRGYLPHFESKHHLQHVTVHLADSLPREAIEQIDEMIRTVPGQERTIERRKRLNAWMDAGHGSCILKPAEVAKIVQDALMYFEEERYRLFAWVIMPNHFHVLFQSFNNWTLAKIVASWKKFTARQIRDWLNANQEICDPGFLWMEGFWLCPRSPVSRLVLYYGWSGPCSDEHGYR